MPNIYLAYEYELHGTHIGVITMKKMVRTEEDLQKAVVEAVCLGCGAVEIYKKEWLTHNLVYNLNQETPFSMANGYRVMQSPETQTIKDIIKGAYLSCAHIHKSHS